MQENYFHAKMNIEKAIRWQSKNPTYLELSEAIKVKINQSGN